MNLFEKDASKPGKVILLVGIVVYVFTLIIFLIGPGFSKEIADRAILVLLSLPIFLLLLTIIFVPGILFIGILTGTPIVSFSYAFSRAKYYWRSIFGSVLFVAIIIALIVIIMGL